MFGPEFMIRLKFFILKSFLVKLPKKTNFRYFIFSTKRVMNKNIHKILVKYTVYFNWLILHTKLSYWVGQIGLWWAGYCKSLAAQSKFWNRANIGNKVGPVHAARHSGRYKESVRFELKLTLVNCDYAYISWCCFRGYIGGC